MRLFQMLVVVSCCFVISCVLFFNGSLPYLPSVVVNNVVSIDEDSELFFVEENGGKKGDFFLYVVVVLCGLLSLYHVYSKRESERVRRELERQIKQWLKMLREWQHFLKTRSTTGYGGDTDDQITSLNNSHPKEVDRLLRGQSIWKPDRDRDKKIDEVSEELMIKIDDIFDL